MIGNLDFYYFSPTGGTKRAGEMLAKSIAEKINFYNLADKENVENKSADIALISVPVFSGRIPAFVTEKLKSLNGNGKKAVTVAVYGTRAYDDALIELNDIIKSDGFKIVASATLVAQHSIVPEVGAGRPDGKDAEELKDFGKKILEKLEKPYNTEVSVNGNFPYKEVSPSQVTPLSNSDCNLCKKCVSVCPANAITVDHCSVVTNGDKCFLCMACVYACPASARALPSSMQEALNQKLGVFIGVRRENELFI